MKIYDISQEVFSCNVYPGDPIPEKRTLSSMENGDLYNLTAFSMCAHNGTHIDAPAHFLADGKTVEQMPLDTFVGDCYVARHEGNVTAEDAVSILEKAGVPSDRILLEDRASTTVENMKFCNNLLQERFPGKPLRLAVVTSNFHVYRATQLAKGFFPEYTLWGVGATYPKDNAEEYLSDPVMPQWVTNECRCLWGHTRSGLVPDFTL